MRLTTIMKDAFVRSALDDLPHVDYEEQIRKLVVDDLMAQVPEAVMAMFNDEKLRAYVHVAGQTFGRPTNEQVKGEGNYYFSGVSVYDIPARQDDKLTLTSAVARKVSALGLQAHRQAKKKKDLQNTLTSAIMGYSTVKGLAEAMPDFAKYLPKDSVTAARSVPVVADVLSKFQAAGWPKGSKAKREAVAA